MAVVPYELNIYRMQPLIARGDIDFGFMTLFPDQETQDAYETLFEEEILLAVPAFLEVAGILKPKESVYPRLPYPNWQIILLSFYERKQPCVPLSTPPSGKAELRPMSYLKRRTPPPSSKWSGPAFPAASSPNQQPSLHQRHPLFFSFETPPCAGP